MAFHDLHVTNAWTIAIWLKPGRDDTDETVLDLRSDGSNENRVRVEKLGTVSNDPVQVSLYDSAGALFKQYRYDSVVPAGAWELVVFTWNGTTLIAYAAGAAVAASSTPTNNAGTMTSTVRSVTVGADYAHAAFYEGYVHSVGLWSSVLAADEVTHMYNFPTFWWRQDADDYVSGLDLQHWWRLGEPTRNDFEGTTWVVDAGYAVEGIDLSIVSANVTDADIVAEVPSVLTIVKSSLYFNGTDEYLANTTDRDWGITNAWTFAFSILRLTDDTSMAEDGVICLKPAASSNNRIQFGWQSGTSVFFASIYNASGTLFKRWSWVMTNDGNPFSWYNIVISWDGTDLDLAANGMIHPTFAKATNTSSSQTNTNRKITMMAINTLAGTEYSGLLGAVAIWNEALSGSEKEDISVDLMHRDLGSDSGAYASSANLIHYFRPGLAPTGLETGPSWLADNIGAAGIDLSANAANMSAADVVSGPMDVPYLPSEYAHAISLDGSTQYIQTAGDENLYVGATDHFSIKFTFYSRRDTHDETILHIAEIADNDNNVKIQKLGAQSGDPLRIEVLNNTGGAYKDYRWNGVCPANQWVTFTMTFDADADTMKLYDETGSELTPDTLTSDLTGIGANGVRQLTIGANQDASEKFYGYIRQIAMFNTDLNATNLAFMAGHNHDLHRYDATAWPPNDLANGYRTMTMWLLLGVPFPATWVQTTMPPNASVFCMNYPGRYFISAADAQYDLSASSGVSASDIVALKPS